MNKEIILGGKHISADSPTFIVAEMSANHLQDYNRAVEIIHAAKEAGADAIKLQTYTAATMTVDSDADYFVNKGGLWDGMTESSSINRPIPLGNGMPAFLPKQKNWG